LPGVIFAGIEGIFAKKIMKENKQQTGDIGFKFFFIWAITVAALFGAINAVMAAPPDAGTIIRDIKDKPFEVPPHKPDEIIKPSVTPKEPEVKGPKIFIRGFRIKGSTRFTEEQLKTLIAEYVGKELSFAELEDVTKKIAAYYKAAGYVVRVYMPEQEVKDGIVEIIVVESRLESIELDKDSKSRLPFDRAKRYITQYQPIGELLRVDKMEKGMLLLNDLTGISVTSNLQPGSKPGMTKQVIKLTSTPLVTANIDMDNTGSRSTGQYRTGLSLNVNNPSGIGDQLSFKTLLSFDDTPIVMMRSTYGRIAYSLPIGYSGLRAGISAANLKYKLGGDFKALNGNGSSNTIGTNISYPFVKSREFNLSGNLSYDHKQLYDELNQATTANKRINSLTLGLSSGIFDSVGGGGMTSLNINLIGGWLDRGRDQSDLSSDQTTAKTQGEYKKIQTNVSRLQKLTESTFLTVGFTNQTALKNLDSSEDFSLGGASGVRAYPSGEASGDEGTMVNTEVKQIITRNLAVVLFYDYGRILINKDEWTSTNTPNSYSLRGIGSSLEVIGWGVYMKITIATRVGGNPASSGSGNDSDGTKRDPRIWFTISKQL